MLDQLPFHTVDITKSGCVDFLTPSITIGKIAGPTITNPMLHIAWGFVKDLEQMAAVGTLAL